MENRYNEIPKMLYGDMHLANLVHDLYKDFSWVVRDVDETLYLVVGEKPHRSQDYEEWIADNADYIVPLTPIFGQRFSFITRNSEPLLISDFCELNLKELLKLYGES